MGTCIAGTARVWSTVAWMVGLSIVSTAASRAEPAHPVSMPDIAGRWRSETKMLVLDIMPCGGKFCGQEVIATGCGKTLLSLGKATLSGEMWTMDGTLDPPGEPKRHQAVVGVYADPSEGLIMHIDAYIEAPTIEHRTIPFEAMYKRIGPPTCRPAPTS